MRTRQWRRFKLEIIVKKRLKKFSTQNWYIFKTANLDKIQHHDWVDTIGTKDFHFFKSHTTFRYHSCKSTSYSPNKNRSFYRFKKLNRESFGYRECDKREFFKILKEHGLK
jgi:hypothetical protein